MFCIHMLCNSYNHSNYIIVKTDVDYSVTWCENGNSSEHILMMILQTLLCAWRFGSTSLCMQYSGNNATLFSNNSEAIASELLNANMERARLYFEVMHFLKECYYYLDLLMNATLFKFQNNVVLQTNLSCDYYE